MQDKTTKITLLVDGAQSKAETAEISKGFDGIAKSAQSSAVVSTGALNQIEASERALAVSTEQLQAIQSQLGATTTELANLQRRLAAAEELAATAAAEAAAAQKALTAATIEGGEAAELGAGKVVRLGVSVSKLGEVAIPGGRAMAMLAGSFSLAIIPQLALIAGIALLVGWIIQRIRATHDLITVNDEALKQDVASAKSMEGQQKLALDLQSLMLSYKSAKEALTKSTREETEGYYKVINAGEEWNKILASNSHGSAYAQIYANLFGTTLKDVEEKQQKLTQTRQKDEVALNKIIDQIRTFALETGKSSQEMLRAARSAGVEGDQLDALQKELTSAEYAQRRFNLAVQDAKLPSVDYSKTRDAILALQQSVKAGFDETTAAGIKRYDDQVRANASSLGKLSQAVKDHTIAMKDLDSQTQQAVARYDQLTAKVHSSAGAIRAYANELINLRKAAESAELQLKADTFEKRAEMIKIDIQAQRDHLEVNKRDRLAALDYLDRTERAQLEKLSQDKVKAEQMVAVETARIDIGAIKDEAERKRKLMEIDIALKELELQATIGGTKRGEELIDNWKRAKREEFNRWEKAENAKAWLEQRLIREEEERKYYENIKKEREKFFAQQRQAREEIERQYFEGLAGRFENVNAPFARGGREQTIDQKRLEQLDQTMQSLGITQSQFDVALQATNRDLGQFEQLMVRTQQFRTGNWFAGLIGSIKDVGKAFVLSGVLGQQWSQALVGAFDLAINSGANFISAFGKLLLGGMMQAFGQMAVTQGTFHILSGIARMATIWDFAGGLKEFAAGTALVAFGAALGAAGSMISKSATPTTAATASTAAGNTAAASSATPASVAPKPIFLSVPTAPKSAAERMLEAQRDLALQRSNRQALAQRDAMMASSGPITIAITLGNDASTQFLTGLMNKKGVLTIDNAIGRHRARLRAALS